MKQDGNRFGKTRLKYIIYHTKITYTIDCYIGYYMLTKKHMITPEAKIIYHQCVIDVVNTMKQLIMFFYDCKNRKKYGTLLKP